MRTSPRAGLGPAASKARRDEQDVIALPHAGRARGVDQRRVLPIDRARVPVGIGHIVIAVQDLDLVPAHQEHAAVPASLAVPLDHLGRRPLDVQVAVAECLLGLDAARARYDLHAPVADHVPVVIGSRQPEIEGEFITIANTKQAEIIVAGKPEKVYELDLKGDYQKQNVQGVLEVINKLQKQGYTIEEKQIEEGLKHTIPLTGIKGRWQVLSKQPFMVCDTAHNQQGVEAVLKQIKTISYRQLHIVWGMVSDKDVIKIMELFKDLS